MPDDAIIKILKKGAEVTGSQELARLASAPSGYEAIGMGYQQYYKQKKSSGSAYSPGGSGETPRAKGKITLADGTTVQFIGGTWLIGTTPAPPNFNEFLSSHGVDPETGYLLSEMEPVTSTPVFTTPTTPSKVLDAATGKIPIVSPSNISKDVSETFPTVQEAKSKIIYTKEQGIEKAYFEPSKELQTASDVYTKTADVLKKDLALLKSPFALVSTGKGGKKIVPSASVFYTFETPSGTKTLPGAMVEDTFAKQYKSLISEYESQGKDYSQLSSSLFQSGVEALKEWHPETTLTKTASGFEVNFPYAGAESYGTYKSILGKSGFGGLLATAFTSEDILGIPSAFYMATGQKQKALDVKIKALYGTSQKSLPEFVISNPLVQIGISTGIGMGIGVGSGVVTGAVAGKYGAGSLAMWGLKAFEAGAGGVMIGLTAADIKQTYDIQGPGEALGKGVLTGFMFGSGAAGYKLGQNMLIKGATPYEYGFRRGFESRIKTDIKLGKITPELGETVLEASKLEFDLRRALRNVKVDQPEIDFSKVSTLKDEPKLQEFFSKHTLRRKSGIYGSLSEGQESVHDIDVMYRNLSRGMRETGYAASKLTKVGNIKEFADIKPWQSTGSRVGRMGTVKQPWYVTKEGYNIMRLSESALRHGESSLELAHVGRTKDISRAIDLYTRLYKAAGEPVSLKPTLARYSEVMSVLEEKPLLMSPKESVFTYGGKSLGEYWQGFKGKIYEIFAPSSWQEKSFLKTMGYGEPTASVMKVSTSVTPPSVSPSVSSFLTSPSIVLATSLPKAITPSATLTPSIVKTSITSPSVSLPKTSPLISSVKTVSPSTKVKTISPSISITKLPSSTNAVIESIVPSTSMKKESMSKPSVSYSVKPISPKIASPSFSVKTSSTFSPSLTIPSPSISSPSMSLTPKSPKSTIPSIPYPSSYISKYLVIPEMPVVPRNMFGIGGRQRTFNLFGEKKKFRAVKIKSPFEGIRL